MTFSKALFRFAGIVIALGSLQTYAFDASSHSNVAAYWGQNAWGNTGHSPTQKTIDAYCNDDSVDIFAIAFVNDFFSTGGLPNMDLDNICANWNQPIIPGTTLPNCQFLASAIQKCQAKGKAVTISLGGGGVNPKFSSDAQAQQFADTIWNLFLGGSSSTRPFGNAVLDGVDLDIEGGSQSHFVAFVNQLKNHFNGASKKYYLTAAPQCPFPDAYVGNIINSVGFDLIYVQFYNNYCAVNAYPHDWNFGTWDNWAKNTSPNKDVKIYIGVPGAPDSADWGYVDINTLTPIIQTTKATYSSFGGVMYWDVSSAYGNGRFDRGVRAALHGGSSTPLPPSNPPGAVELHPNGDNSKCLDVQSASYTNGTPVQIYDCNGTNAQKWIISPGQTSAQVAGTNFCLDAGTSPTSGTKMKIWQCFSGLAAQTWHYTDDKRVALENQGQCLDLTNGDKTDGNVMQIWQCTDNDTNQVWTGV